MDRDRLEDKLADLERFLQELEEDLPGDVEDYLTDRKTRRACEKDFELVSETVVDVANLVISGQGLERPTDSRDTVHRLAAHDIISPDLAEDLAAMIGFRNLLVHRYDHVDDRRVYSYLGEEIEDARAFLRRVRELLDAEQGG